MKGNLATALAVAATALALALAAGGTDGGGGGATASGGGGGGGGGGPIGVDLPRADSDFWNSYADFVPRVAGQLGVELLSPTNSQNDVGRLVANVQALVGKGAKAIVMAPQDTGAVASTLDRLEQRGVPVVTVDTRPDKGRVYMVVRADNRAYGEKACEFLGEQLGGEGKVVELQGALSSINGRDRSAAFETCMERRFPRIRVFAEPTEWEGARAAAALQTRLNQHPDIKGIYMQAGGVFLAPTLQVLRSKDKLFPAGDDRHVVIVSNDGIPEELQAIRAGQIDATVSQPADEYARRALAYAKAATEGRTFRPGRTPHGSAIVRVENGNLEDQLPAPLVTRENVDDPALWGNQVRR